MAIQVDCGQCKTQLNVRDELAGKRGKCPKCGTVLAIPELHAAAQTAVATATAPAPRPAPPARPATQPAAAAAQPTPKPRPPAAAKSDGPRSFTELQAYVLSAFQADLPRLASPLSYRLGILIAAFVMILLPLIYMALIALVAYGVYWHAVYNSVMLQVEVRGRGYILVLIAYVAPMAIGAILVLFMIKPLFARSSQLNRGRSLTRDGEPLLFAFVDRICKAVRAPLPKRIDVDCQVNASASFRRGMLSFLGNDLVLTIGMPLVAGLNMRQFGGVLAHEFGHFSQGAGMRLSYLVRSIAFWFQRVAHERDEWDDWLRDTAQSSDLRIGWILYLAMLFVWLTRKVLFGLTMLGYTVAGFLLRQMEFDADRYETHFAGSDTFEATSRQMTVLNVAMHGAQADLGQFYQEGRLADNLPKLMHANVGQIPPATLQKIQASIDESKTGWFDTHPSDRQRIASSQRENAPGVFRLDLPARQLFRDFDDVARKVTWDYYRDVLGPRVKMDDMHSVDDLLVRQGRDQATYQSLKRYFQGCYHPGRSLQVAQFSAEESKAQQLVEIVKAGRKSLLGERGNFRPLVEKFSNHLERKREIEQVLGLKQAGIDEKLKPSTKVPMPGRGAAQASQDVEGMLRDLSGLLRPYEIPSERRFFAALKLLAHPKVAARLDDAEGQQRFAQQLTTVLARLNSVLPRCLALECQFGRLVALCERIEANRESERFVNALLNQAEKVADETNDIRQQFQQLDYPFDHAQADMTIAKFLRADPIMDKRDLGEVYEGAEATIGKLTELTARVAGNLAAIAEQVESALGLEPLPEVPDEASDAS